MIIENEMIHGGLPRGGGSQRKPERRAGRGFQRLDRFPSPGTSTSENPKEALGEWDASIRDFEGGEVPASGGTAGTARSAACRRTGIQEDTQIVPHAVAFGVWEEASLWLKASLPRGWVAELEERAEAIYQHNARFRQLLSKPGNAGRDWLRAFTRHWLCGLLACRRPDLFARLPRSYAVGLDLPVQATEPPGLTV